MSPGIGPAPVAGGLVDVRLLGVPLALLDRSREHLDSLERELRLLDLTASDESPEVGRLLDFFADGRRAPLVPGRAEDDQVDAARRRGDPIVDLVVQVGPSMADACREVGALLDEADRFCRRGDLLNLATPADCVALRRWYLGELLAQLEGAPPSPWRSTG